MHSPFARLPGDATPAGIGHNQGPPLDAGTRWRTHCWKTARKSLVGTIPLEVVRRRVKRARELGLDYPAYASILLGSGRDIVGFLFTCDAIGLRLQRTLPLPVPVRDKLEGLTRCDRLLLGPGDSDPADLAQVLRDTLRPPFRAAGPGPADGRPAEARRSLRALLDPLNIPGDAIVMIGTRAEERDWAEAARLSKFMSSDAYFSPAA